MGGISKSYCNNNILKQEVLLKTYLKNRIYQFVNIYMQFTWKLYSLPFPRLKSLNSITVFIQSQEYNYLALAL